MTAWYIDAIDPLAGFCFASKRDADLDDPDLDEPAVYLAPPLFQPEIVGSRAAALASARGSFQLGLWTGDVEVDFPSLASLTEFVRRCYISGGRTDGGGGRDPIPPPPRPEGGEPIEPPGFEGSEGGEAVRRLSDAANKFAQLAANASDDPVEVSYERASTLKATRPRGTDRDALGAVAASIVAELFARFPNGGSAAQVHQWSDSAARLGVALAGLGLWDAVLERSLDRLLRLAEQVGYFAGMALPRGLRGLPRREQRYILLHLLGVADLPWWSDEPLRRIKLVTDPIDDLASWPVARWPVFPEIASVRDLLAAAIAKPDLLRHAPPYIIATLVFAASHILNRQLAVGGFGTGDVSRLVHEEHVTRAADWLIAQLPTYAFRRDLEQMIAGVGTSNIEGDDHGYSTA